MSFNVAADNQMFQAKTQHLRTLPKFIGQAFQFASMSVDNVRSTCIKAYMRIFAKLTVPAF